MNTQRYISIIEQIGIVMTDNEIEFVTVIVI